MMTVVFRQDFSGLNALDRTVPINAGKACKNVAQRAVDEIRNNWSPESPSAPGEPPAMVTGYLDSTVEAENQGRNALGQFASGDSATSYVVRVKAPYADFLEHGTRKMEPRPFLLAAVMRAGDSLPDEFKGVISARIR